MARALTPAETFLAPLAALARRWRDLEGLVFWGGADGWDTTPTEALESEEIAFYAEGLLLDGFRMRWSLVAQAEAPELPDHLRLCFWQDDGPPPDLPPGWVQLDGGVWAGA